MNPFAISLLLIISFSLFGVLVYKKIKLLSSLAPFRNDSAIQVRIKRVIVSALFQKRLMKRKKERFSGWLHAFIFWGFWILSLRSLTLIGEGFQTGFHLPLLGPEFISGYIYLFLKDLTEALILLTVFTMMVRRKLSFSKRLENTKEAWLILILITLLMISDFIYDASRFAQIKQNITTNLPFYNNPNFGEEFLWTPFANFATQLIPEASTESLYIIMAASYWFHIVCLLAFLCLLPFGKHFHIITAIPNLYFKNPNRIHEPIQLLDLEDEKSWEEESLGINHIHQLSWKQGLDLYSCTECGRCKDVCPTHATGSNLNLKNCNDRLKKELKENSQRIIKKSDLKNSKQLIGDVITKEDLWSCTTCAACESACPVGIEQVPRIISMRQGQLLMAESYPKELNSSFKGLERHGNPWGIAYDKRADWAKGLGVKTLAENSDVDYLFWVGCSGSFDQRSQKVAKAVVKILQQANISFGILGVEEKCTGDYARRVGNEMLYQMMAAENIEKLNRYGVKKIITFCPHCLNTLSNDYPQMGGQYTVIHHSQFIWGLIQQGKLSIKKEKKEPLTYHDPCYLGRYNNIYQPPREIINQITQTPVVELPRHGQESFCCGAGGGKMWMEENLPEQINTNRAKEISDSGLRQIALGCPFCLTMIEDGVKTIGKDETLQAMDIAEIVAEALESGGR